MKPYNPQAEELNKTLENAAPAVFSLLSEKGRAIYFPKTGLLSQAAQAKGAAVNATVGMGLNDDGTPMRLPSIDQYIDLDPQLVYPYAPSYGIPELRAAWRELIFTRNPSLRGPISLPLVSSGLTHGLSVTGQLFVDPGDTMVLPDIYWGNYRLVFNNGCGAQFIHYKTFKSGGYNIQGLASCLEGSGRKQIVIINFPHNPTGYTVTDSEAEELAAVFLASAERGNRIAVMFDDAYFGLVYQKGIFKESVFAKLARLHPNILAVKIDGATKEDYAWGFRVGYITYASAGLDEQSLPVLEEKTGGIIRSTISNASRLSQSLILKGLQSPEYAREKQEKFDILQQRYRTVCDILEKNRDKYADAFTPMPFNSGYFMCLELKTGLNAETIRQRLLAEHSIGVIALGNMLRIAFSSVPAAALEGLFENIYRCCR
ncbi:aminotransferase class I/II-fold pyridoxal phosphate-dependent enzyme [bacterium]|nr:aminotransferase class I/II-fold pyridoxal phosphate-dependent enzyme [bacterium]